MTEPPGPNIPTATVVQRRRGINAIWVVPIAALIASAWLVYQAVVSRGPVITIHFGNAEGIEAGKTRLRYLNVEIGKVTAVKFADGGTGVTVTAEMMPGSDSRLTDTTRFWVVKPRLEATGVSGLSTLLSGAYIGMDPGEGGRSRRRFEALDEPPRVLSHQTGTVYRLWSPELESLSIGSPVYFRRLQVGSVVGYALSDDHSHVEIEVFVESPHDAFVHQESRFWNVSGVKVQASSDGLDIDVESLVALASGGVAFRSPPLPGAGGKEPRNHVFTHYPSRRESEEQAVIGTHPFLVYFNESVRGLKRDAAVEFRGLRVGTVREILDAKQLGNGEVRIGVLLGLDPERMPYDMASDLPTGWERRLQWVQRLADSGARAQLKAGNLITGQKFIEIDIVDNPVPVQVTAEMGYPVIPSAGGALEGITQSLASILTQVEAIPITEIGRDLGGAARAANRLANDENLTRTIRNLNTAVSELSALLNEARPLVVNATEASAGLARLMDDASGAVRQAEQTLQAVEATASEEGPMGHEMLTALREMSAAARAIRAMAEYLERHPEALLSGKK